MEDRLRQKQRKNGMVRLWETTCVKIKEKDHDQVWMTT